MPKANPYGGNYAPARLSIAKEDLIRGLKGIKIRAPNRSRSTTAHKSALPKEYGSEGN